MKARLLTLLPMLLLSVATHVANAELTSSYTSLLEADCQTIDNDNFYQALCPAKGDYQLEVYAGDLRSGVELIYDDHRVDYAPVEPSQYGKVAEWRFSAQHSSPAYHAVIYRLHVTQVSDTDSADLFLPPSHDRDQLVVIRLAEEKSCLLGIIEQTDNMNQKARALADDKTAPCIEH